MALERLELLITSTGAAAAKDIKAVGTASEEAATKQSLLQRGANGAKAAISNLTGGLIPAESAMKAVTIAGGALAGVKLAEFAFDAAKEFAGATSEVRGFQRITGTTAEDASRLAVAVKMTGVESKAAETGFFQLEKRIATGKDTLSKYGIEVAYTRDGSVNFMKTLDNVRESFQNIEDPAKRNQLVFENFGKGGAALIPLLSKSSEELKHFYDEAAKHHEIFSQDDLDKGREFTVAMRELDSAFQGLKLEIGQAVIPIVTKTATLFTQGVEAADSLANSIGLDGVGGAVGTLINNLNPLNSATHAVSAGQQLLAGNFAEAGKQALEAIPGVGGYIEDLFGGGDASNKFADAQGLLKDSLGKAAGLLVEGKTKTKGFHDAMGDAKDASNVLSTAQQRLAGFLQTTAEKTYQAQAAALAKIGTDLALEGSTLGVADALDNYNKIQFFGQQADETTEEYQRRVEHAHLDVKTALFGVIQAASNKAAAEAGPNASASDVAKLKADAQRQALTDLSNQFPGLRDEIFWYGISLLSIPATRETAIYIQDSQAWQALGDLAGQLEYMVSRPWVIDLAVSDPYGIGLPAR